MIPNDLLGIAGLTPGGIGAIGTFGLVLVAMIRGWPLLAKLSIDARARIWQQDRDELHDCQSRLDALDARLTAGEGRARSVELRLVSALSAVTLLAGEVQRLSPKSDALKQAQWMLRAAYPIASEMPPYLADILKPLEELL